MEITKTSSNGIQFIAKEEGLVKRPYLDQAGIPTIGIGMTYYPDTGKKVTMQDPPLTDERAVSLFGMMLKNYELGVYSVTRDDINQNQFDALTSLTYNIGVYGFKGSTLRSKVNSNPSDPTIAEGFESWRNATINGVKKPVLLGRRKREVKLYFTPVTEGLKSAQDIYKDHVKHIQTKLGLKLVDGIFGQETKNAVIAFQKNNGLDPDGIAGPRTLEILNKL